MTATLFTLIFLFSAFLGIVGLIAPQKVGMPTRTRAAAFYGGMWILSALALSAIPSTPSAPPVTKSASTSKPTPSMSKADQQAKVKEFEAMIEKIDTPALAAQKNFTNVASKGYDGSNVVDLINLARKTKQDFEKASVKISKVPIDKGLPPETRDAMANVKANITLAYGYRSDAMESILKFFDEEKPSQIADFKSQLQEADNSITAASTHQVRARLSVGLK